MAFYTFENNQHHVILIHFKTYQIFDVDKSPNVNHVKYMMTNNNLIYLLIDNVNIITVWILNFIHFNVAPAQNVWGSPKLVYLLLVTPESKLDNPWL